MGAKQSYYENHYNRRWDNFRDIELKSWEEVRGLHIMMMEGGMGVGAEEGASIDRLIGRFVNRLFLASDRSTSPLLRIDRPIEASQSLPHQSISQSINRKESSNDTQRSTQSNRLSTSTNQSTTTPTSYRTRSRTPSHHHNQNKPDQVASPPGALPLPPRVALDHRHPRRRVFQLGRP
jgi:hypothetical protein